MTPAQTHLLGIDIFCKCVKLSSNVFRLESNKEGNLFIDDSKYEAIFEVEEFIWEYKSMFLVKSSFCLIVPNNSFELFSFSFSCNDLKNKSIFIK